MTSKVRTTFTYKHLLKPSLLNVSLNTFHHVYWIWCVNINDERSDSWNLIANDPNDPSGDSDIILKFVVEISQSHKTSIAALINIHSFEVISHLTCNSEHYWFFFFYNKKLLKVDLVYNYFVMLDAKLFSFFIYYVQFTFIIYKDSSRKINT